MVTTTVKEKKIKFPYIKFNKIQNTRAVSAQDRSHKILLGYSFSTIESYMTLFRLKA